MSMISTVLQTAEAKERTYRCNANKEESKSGDYVCTETTVEVPVFVYFLCLFFSLCKFALIIYCCRRYQRNHSPESHLPISEFSGSAPPAPPTPIYLPQSGKVSAQNIIIEVPRATLTDPAGIGIQVCKPSCNFSWGAWQICKLEEDGTAKASGQLKVGDWIHAVYDHFGNPVSSYHLVPAHLERLLKGPPGSFARLVISRNNVVSKDDSEDVADLRADGIPFSQVSDSVARTCEPQPANLKDFQTCVPDLPRIQSFPSSGTMMYESALPQLESRSPAESVSESPAPDWHSQA